jgi:DNA polymerase I-like protein with 3'-5' exonuclease and polymerase domains
MPLSPITQTCYGGVRVLDHPCLPNVRRLDEGAIPMIWEYHRHGIHLNKPHFYALSKRLAAKSLAVSESITSLIGHPVNHNSGDQVAALLFHELGLKVRSQDGPKLTASNSREQVDDEVLMGLKDQHPVVPLILQGRQTDKLKGTYVDKLPAMVAGDGRLHTTFRHTVAATGRLASEDPNLQNCFDGSTELLTPSGWWRLDSLDLSAANLSSLRVAQWTQDGSVEMVTPSASTTQPTRKLLSITSQHIDLFVTSDHRCPLQHRKTKGLRVFPACQYPEDWRQLHGGTYTTSGPGLPYSDDMLKLIVAMQADGSWCREHNESIDFGFSKPRKVERLRAILDNLQAPYHEAPGSRGRTRFYLPQSAHTNILMATLGKEKQFRWELPFSMNPHQLQVFCHEVMLWDGCSTTLNQYASKHKINADIVATAYAFTNRRAVVRKYISNGGSVSWQVDVTQRNYSLTTNVERGEAGPQTAYCVSVPSSFLLIRRNGKIMVSGNCPTRTEEGMEVRRGFHATKDSLNRQCLLVSLDLSQIEMVLAGHLSQDRVLLQAFADGTDIHTLTAISAFQLPNGPHILYLCRKALDEEAGKPIQWLPGEKEEWKVFKSTKRLPSKTVGFGILYGQTAEGAQGNIVAQGGPYLTLEAVERVIDGWFTLYSGVTYWMETQYFRAQRYGMVWDMFGRIRLMPGAQSKLRRIRNEAFRQAGNMPITSSAQGLIKLDMAQIMPVVQYFQSFPDVRCWPLLQIHDELIFELSPNIVDEFCGIAQEIMQTNIQLTAPVKASWGVAERWGDLK